MGLSGLPACWARTFQHERSPVGRTGRWCVQLAPASRLKLPWPATVHTYSVSSIFRAFALTTVPQLVLTEGAPHRPNTAPIAPACTCNCPTDSIVGLVQLPSSEEINAVLHGRKLTTIIFFLDETFEEVQYRQMSTSMS